MVAAKNEDGEYMSCSAIANVLIGLLVGAEYEISSLITIVIYYLAELPHIYNQVLEDCKIERPERASDDEGFGEDEVVVRECLRLTPPSLGAFKESTAEFTYAGFTIPKGWKRARRFIDQERGKFLVIAGAARSMIVAHIG
ncbi:hypothetical protein SASPL_148034 [Salvia splendens]|uniref:Uncharacterized protein n=1 Tax=Salvia splendens TaxID=180675 RepID=A0A8X8Z402_SALSN|nr:hypothetical protein SASPL_148034 [Salvia splendens]